MEPIFTRTVSPRSVCAQCRIRLLSPRTSPFRSVSTTSRNRADSPIRPPNAVSEDVASSAINSIQQPTNKSSDPSVTDPNLSPSDPHQTIQNGQPPPLKNIISGTSQNEPASLDALSSYINSSSLLNSNSLGAMGRQPPPPPHHLHVYATKHNTHITLSKPDRNPILSVSSGTIGFRKAARGSYDAGYQLGAYVMGRIQQQGLLNEIKQLEVVLRDFGPGREAITKILLGSEGRNLRGRVIRICDATRLKFGGTRSPKPRRLG